MKKLIRRLLPALTATWVALPAAAQTADVAAPAAATSEESPATASADFTDDMEDAHLRLIKAMTGIDPLTRETITEPPYGAEGWMPIAPDSLVRFAGKYYPNEFDNDGTTYQKDASHSYIREKEVRLSSTYSNYHQPFAVTVRQRRDHGRRTEPVTVYFVADKSKGYSMWTQQGSWTKVVGDIYVQSMIENPECTTVGHRAAGEWDNIYSPTTLIHQTRRQDDMVSGDFSNNIKRNEAFDALVSAAACDLDGDGYDEIVVFYTNTMDVFDGKTFEYKKSVDLSTIDGTFASSLSGTLSYGYDTTMQGNVPNTWTSVVSDIDGDGTDDILAICHSGFYWDHLKAIYPDKDEHVISETGTVRSIFIPGGKGMDATPVVNSMGRTPKLMWDAKDPSSNNSSVSVLRYNRFPRWNDTSYNNHDGIFNHDMYHYYHVTLTADVAYPNGMFNSTQPVLAIAWKYLWSDSPTESGDKSYTDREFREGLHEWYQLTTYNLTDDRTAFTQQNQGAPTCTSKVDIYELLNKANEWHEACEVSEYAVTTYLHYSQVYNRAVNARASLRRPAFKTWYAGGRTMPPFLFFEGMNLYFNPGLSGSIGKYSVAAANALGHNSGWTGDTNPCGRICGPLYTYYNHIDEDEALDDRESLMVPVATRKVTDSDSNRYQDNEYGVVTGKFDRYDSSNQSVTKVGSDYNGIGSGPSGQNAIFHYVPFTANTAKVELQGSYFTASNPMVKAVLAIPPFNTDDVANPGTAGVSVIRSSSSGSEQGNTTSTSVGGGFSLDFTLFKMLKFGYSYNYDKSWSNSWGKSQDISQSTEYQSAGLTDMVLFNYIPVDCFYYKVTEAPYKPEAEGKTFTFRRALNMLNGEAHMPELCWTLDDYNTYVSGTGVPAINKNLLAHKIGVRDSYRRVALFTSKENLIKEFPVKEGGFWAVNDGVSTGTSDIEQELNVSNGHSQGSSTSVSQSHKVSFGVSGSLTDEVFAGGLGVEMSFGHSDSWSTSTSWSESMGVKGKIPALKNVKDSYTLYQVWYEYADEASGQDFLVLDWAVGQQANTPLYSDLEMVEMFDGEYDQTAIYMPHLNWSVNSNTPVSKCVLEYKVDGITPIRDYPDDGISVTLPAEATEWVAVEKRYDSDNAKWVNVDFSNPHNKGLISWDFYDIFSLTAEQQAALREKASGDLSVHYRVKFYDSSDTYMGGTNEVSRILLTDISESLVFTRTMEVDLFKLPYGKLEGSTWTAVESKNEDKSYLFGKDTAEAPSANLTNYTRLDLYGAANGAYLVNINGTAVTVGLDDEGKGSLDLESRTGAIHLRSIRTANGTECAESAHANAVKIFDEDAGRRVYGKGAFDPQHDGYAFYEAFDVRNTSITFPLTNPNALVAGGSNINGVDNMLWRTTECEEGFTAKSIDIYDGYPLFYDFGVKCPRISYIREGISSNAKYVTAVLPFAVKAGRGVYEYVNCDESHVYFSTPSDGVIDAYLPIIIDVEDATEINLTGENLAGLERNGNFNINRAVSTGYEMMYGFVTRRQEGILLTDAELADYDVYGFSMASHQFVKVLGSFAISPFRAFFLVPKNTPANSSRAYSAASSSSTLNIVINGQEVDGTNTSIDGFESDEAPTTPTYNLMGLPVDETYKGYGIRNGKIVLIK